MGNPLYDETNKPTLVRLQTAATCPASFKFYQGIVFKSVKRMTTNEKK